VLQLRRDYPEARRRWTLGEHGSFEMRAEIVEIAARFHGGHTELHMSGRLWDPAGTTMTGVDVEMRPVNRTAVDVVLQPSQRLPEWFREHDLEHWRELAHAALDELCEELLFYASRDRGDVAVEDDVDESAAG
jgi:hypothetical protein